MFCQNCGEQIPENAKFCNRCGAAQVNSSAQSTQQQKPQPQQPNLAAEEKAFKKFVTPHTSRDAFIVLLGLTVISCFVMPQAAFIYAVFAAIFAIPWAIGCNRVNKQITSLRAAGKYEELLNEFAASAPMLDGKVRYSENYVFGKGYGRFFAFKDIEWIYRHNVSYIFIPIRSDAIIGDSKGKIAPMCKVKLGGQSGNQEITSLATLIYEKNPDVLIGYDDETVSKYKDRDR